MLTYTTTTRETESLDRFIWAALTSRQREISTGDDLARRYLPDYAPFVALADDTPAAIASLHAILSQGDRAAAFTVAPLLLPEDRFVVDLRDSGDQMVATILPPPNPGIEIVPLTAADAPEMRALVDLTRPGPFAARTHEMGAYVGVRVDGRLVAMAGERIRLDGFTEVSAVCTHPEFRGRGYAGELVIAVSRRILARGETPFLHVFSHNTTAIALYRKLGFRLRRTFHLTVVRARPSQEG